MKILSLLSATLLFLPFLAPGFAEAQDLNGRILLQVEERGEAWWVNPSTGERHFMYRAENAYDLMRSYGVGIRNADLKKIPIGYFEMSGPDTDSDGLSNAMEHALGTDVNNSDSDGDSYNDGDEVREGFNPIGQGSISADMPFTRQHLGKIFLQVEDRGEAWWVNPEDGKRYFLGQPEDAYEIMRNFGLGISNEDISSINISDSLMQCGDNLSCLSTAVALGQPADSLVELAVQVSEAVESVSRDAYTYYGGEMGIEVDVEPVFAEFRFTESHKAQLQDDGLTEEEILAMQHTELSEMNESIAELDYSVCTFGDESKLRRHFSQLSQGDISARLSLEEMRYFDVETDEELTVCRTVSNPQERIMNIR
jgi:hypothetical protein